MTPERKGLGLPGAQEPRLAILIVEDEILIRLALADYLQECGFKVFESGSAAEAVEILASDRAAINLVFSDVNLPGEMNGFALAQWVRRHRPGLPVVLTSGDAKMATAARELCESESFLHKPYDLAAVVAQIRDLLDRRKEKI